MNALTILCQEFSQLTGVKLDLSIGPVRLDIGQFGPWWLEADSSQRVLTFYHTVGQAKPSEFAHWLDINCQFSLLGGAWLAYHQPTETIRLCLLQEVVRLDGNVLANLLDNLQQVRTDLPMPLYAHQ
ncbi:CesT family type III secretion system chaperone [Pseudomonas alkylphenolica]|uniref:CesT family type III secretion system chaperone n=1 Tax=Pseudomonas alkylphenolica TaxID=237609 RepID=UPI0013E36612|nr:CesT family type III secretion system chaperone [Pseudomonas alkylphenolica]